MRRLWLLAPVGVLLLGLLTVSVSGQGPLSAQVQRALRAPLGNLGIGTVPDTNFLKASTSVAPGGPRIDIANTSSANLASAGFIARSDTAQVVLDAYSSGMVGGPMTGALYANLIWLRPVNAGTFLIGGTSAVPIALATNNLVRWQVDGTGMFVAGLDNTYDIGASGATRPRTAYIGTSVITPAVNATTSLQLNGAIALTATAPTIASFAGSSPAAAVVAGSTTAAFRITVGGTAPGTTGTINLPTATTGWNCWLIDQTTPLDITRQTSSTTASVGITSTIAWTANDTLIGGCTAF